MSSAAQGVPKQQRASSRFTLLAQIPQIPHKPWEKSETVLKNSSVAAAADKPPEGAWSKTSWVSTKVLEDEVQVNR